MSDNRMTDLGDWVASLTKPAALMELGTLALCAVVAWLACTLLRRAVGVPDKTSILFGRRIVDGVLFPLFLLTLAYVARAMLSGAISLAVFKLAIPVLLALLASMRSDNSSFDLRGLPVLRPEAYGIRRASVSRDPPD